jgi:hypothetical protein
MKAVQQGAALGILAGLVGSLVFGALIGAPPPDPTGYNHMSAFQRIWNAAGWGALVNFPKLAPIMSILGGIIGALIGNRHRTEGCGQEKSKEEDAA